MNNQLISENDSVIFSRFQWTNLDQTAKRVEVDVCICEISDSTYTFFDAFLENGLYVTLGLRLTASTEQKASMSVFRHKSDMSLTDVVMTPEIDFEAQIGLEDDVFIMGDYPFKMKECFRLIINAKQKDIEGYIFRWRDKEVRKIGTFGTGDGSHILAKSSNAVALERVGLKNTCERKAQIFIRNPLRIGIDDSIAGATRGMITYQRCPNMNVESLTDGKVYLSHGGDTLKKTPSGWLDWTASEPIDFDIGDYIDI